MTTAPRPCVDEITTRTGAHLFFFDGLNTDYTVTDGTTIFGTAPTFKGAALIQHTHGGRIRLNGRDFTLTTTR